MNTKRLVLALCFALVCSGLLTWQLARHLSHVTVPARPMVMQQLVVAARDLQPGDSLVNGSLTSVTLPATSSLIGAFASTKDLVGRSVQVPIRTGEPVLAHDLAPEGAGTGLAVQIPAGMRAVSVHAQDASETSNDFVQPGSHVDLLVTYKQSGADTFLSSLVLQNAMVLAVGQSRAPGAEDKTHSDGNITLLLSPEETAKTMTAASLGKLTFALRNGADRSTTDKMFHVGFDGAPESTSKHPVVQPAKKQRMTPEPAPRAEFKVETLAGGKASVQTFQGEP